MRALAFRTDEEIHAALPAVVEHLRAGGLLAYPTETVYGFGGTLEPAAVARLVALKHRLPEKPFLVLVASAQQAPDLVWSEEAERLAAAFWPGPLTLVVPSRSLMPPGVGDERGNVALRATGHGGIRALLTALGGPITSTSANAPGEPAALDAKGVRHALRGLGAPERDMLILDGGALPNSLPSTIVDCTVHPPRVLRPGAIPVEALTTVIAELDG